MGVDWKFVWSPPVPPADIPPMLAGVRQGVGNGTKGIQSRKGD